VSENVSESYLVWRSAPADSGAPEGPTAARYSGGAEENPRVASSPHAVNTAKISSRITARTSHHHAPYRRLLSGREPH
jgi:hypothetical protein